MAISDGVKGPGPIAPKGDVKAKTVEKEAKTGETGKLADWSAESVAADTHRPNPDEVLNVTKGLSISHAKGKQSTGGKKAQLKLWKPTDKKQVVVSDEALAAMKFESPPSTLARRRFISVSDLKTEMGRDPKPHKRLFGLKRGPVIWKMSSRYKKVLTSLENYNKMAAEPPFGGAGQSAHLLGKGLQQLENDIDRYLSKDRGGTETGAMQTLKVHIQNERKIVGELARNPATFMEPGMTWDRAIENRHFGIPPSAFGQLNANNDAREVAGSAKILGAGATSVAVALQYKKADGGVENRVFKAATAFDDLYLSAPDSIGIDRSDPRYGARNVASSVMDKAMGTNLMPDTEFAVHAGKLGFVMERVAGRSPQDAELLPLNKQDQHVISVNEDLIEPDDFEESTKDFRAAMDRAGYALKTVGSGKNEKTVWVKTTPIADQFDARDPVLMKMLSDLEWLDGLTGQVDRHPGNYLIDLADDGSVRGLKGIDNDFAFGSSFDKVEKFRDDLARQTHEVGLPQLIDADTADRILHLEWDGAGGLKESLEPYLSTQELDATLSRLIDLQQHVRVLRVTGNEVPSGEWGSWVHPESGKSAAEILANTDPKDTGRSYVKTLMLQIEDVQRVKAAAIKDQTP